MKLKLALAAAVVAALSFVTVQAASSGEEKPTPRPEQPKDQAKEQAKEEAKPSEADAAAIRAQAPTYPLDTCAVSGEKLGSMGKPHVIVHEGQEIKFCCSGCEPDFKKEPAKFLAKLAPKK